ncbi:Structural maintenance of chromosomes protein 4, partial [Exophiala xenobiotica]
MKPKATNEHGEGLLEYLEDITGTSQYKDPMEEAAVELESLNEVCIEKQGRVQHVEKEKNSLEDKKNKALTFIRDENELAEKQSSLYQIYMAECEDNAAVTEEAIQQIQEQLNAELDKHAGSEDAIKELEKAYNKALKQYERIEKQAQEFSKSWPKAQSSDEKHTYDIERKSGEVAELEKETQKEEQELAVIRDNLKGKTQGLSDQIAVKQKSLEPWNAKMNQKQSDIAVAQSELDILTEKANSGQKAIGQAKEKIDGIEAHRAEKLEQIERHKHEKARLEKNVRKIQDALQKLATSEPQVRSQISSARQKAEEARASLASSQNHGNVLKGLLRLKDSGCIDGFHARLGNLGTIDEKFDVAISPACPSLENMVVDNVEIGQQCIQYLRKSNLGRANFVLLDKLAQRDLSPIQTPENVPRL